MYPEGSVPLTADRELFKLLREYGDIKNRSSNYLDTAVAVEYLIKSEKGVIDHSPPNSPLCWITGDKSTEDKLYIFLPICVKTMSEGETASFFISRKYLLGSGKLITFDGRVDDSEYFEAIVHLIKAKPLSDIDYDDNIQRPMCLDQEKSHKSISGDDLMKKSPEEIIEISKSVDDKKAQAQKEELRQRSKYGLYQLSIADKLFESKKIVASRKEYNRARMAWGNNIDVNQVPSDFVHSMIEVSDDQIKQYVNVHSLIGVAKTFLAVNPPLKDKAIASLQEAFELDNACEDVIKMLQDLGVDTNSNSFPDFEDSRLIKPQFWTESIEWKNRSEFANYCNSRGKILYEAKDFKNALKYFNRVQIAFPNQSFIGIAPKEANEIFALIISSKSNGIACHIELGQYENVVPNSDLLIDYIHKTGLPMEHFILKTRYRICLAYVYMNRFDKLEESLKQLGEMPGSKILIDDIKSKMQKQELINTQERDFLYSKMTNTRK